MTALELEELAELGTAYLQRWADVRIVRYWARNPGGDPSRAMAVGMLCGRLQRSFTPSPKLLAQNLAARAGLLAEMLGPERWIAPGVGEVEEELL